MDRRPNHPLLAVFLIAVLGADLCAAQNYPNKPIRILTGGVAGTADSVSRLVANSISGPLGQPVLVENFGGTGSASQVAKGVPDGYSLVLTGGALWISPFFIPVPYDAVRDFTPVAALTRQPTILVVHPSVPAKTVAELIKLAKARPGQLNYSSGNAGSSSHISGALFTSMAGVDILRIPYKSQNTELADLLAGRVHMTLGNGPNMGPLEKVGKVRALATSGLTRSILFPDLPTISETVPGYESEQLLGILAPPKIPAAIVKRLNEEIGRALAMPDVRDQLSKKGLEPVGGTAEQFANSMKSEIAKIAKLIKEGGIKLGEQ